MLQARLTSLLLNAAGFDTRLHEEIERAKRAREQASVADKENIGNLVLITLDLRNLKRINDRYGLDAGDNALIGLADILAGTTRVSDVVGRTHTKGDEFGLLLSETTVDKVRDYLWPRLEDRFSTQSLKVSAGMVQVDLDDPEGSQKRSYDLLNMAKRRSKRTNQTELFTPATPIKQRRPREIVLLPTA